MEPKVAKARTNDVMRKKKRQKEEEILKDKGLRESN